MGFIGYVARGLLNKHAQYSSFLRQTGGSFGPAMYTPKRPNKDRLRSKYAYLVEELDARPFVDLLYQERCMSKREKEMLTDPHKRPFELGRLFVDSLMMKSEDCIQKFFDILKTHTDLQPHIYEELFPEDMCAANGSKPMVSSEISRAVNETRKASSRLGGFWGLSDIPIMVLHQVCRVIGGDRAKEFADLVHVSDFALSVKPKAATPFELVHQIMEIWVQREADKATLDVLFEVLDRMQVLRGLLVNLEINSFSI